MNCSVSGSYGGAICFRDDGSFSVDGCSFVNCSSRNKGGAIYFYSDSVGDSVGDGSFVNCSVSGSYGGAIAFGSSGSVGNCSFVGCSASNGGAIYFFSSGSVVDCIFKTETDTVYGATPTYTSLDQLKDGERPTAKAIKDSVCI